MKMVRRVTGKKIRHFAPPADNVVDNNHAREVTPSSILELSPATTKASPGDPWAERARPVHDAAREISVVSASMHTPPPTAALQPRDNEAPRNLKPFYRGEPAGYCDVQALGRNHSRTTPTVKSMSQCSPTPWSVAKRDQSRRQQRAFSVKRDNPFAMYSHDPNDVETRLASLSSNKSKTDPESIIPEERLWEIDQAYRNLEKTKSRGLASNGSISRRHTRRSPAAQQVLQQKALEQNRHARTPLSSYTSCHTKLLVSSRIPSK